MRDGVWVEFHSRNTIASAIASAIIKIAVGYINLMIDSHYPQNRACPFNPSFVLCLTIVLICGLEKSSVDHLIPGKL